MKILAEHGSTFIGRAWTKRVGGAPGLIVQGGAGFSRRIPLTGLTVAVAVTVTAGCGSAVVLSAASGPEKTHLTVAVLSATDDAPFWLALKNGYFRQEDLTVTPRVVAQSTLAIPEMVRGSIDVIGGANYVSFFGGQASGALHIRVIAPAGSCTADDFSVVALPSWASAARPGWPGRRSL